MLVQGKLMHIILFIGCLMLLDELPAEDGQSFLMERLPAWEEVIENKSTFGCLRHTCVVDGSVISEGMINADGEFRISEESSMPDHTLIAVGFSNEIYNADVEIQRTKPQLLSVSENDDDYWGYHFLMTSFHGGSTFPELIRKQEMVVSGYSVVDGKHYLLFDRDGDDDFVKTELVFDDAYSIPVEMTNWFASPKGHGQKIVFKQFEQVGQALLPVFIEFEDMSGSNKPSGGEFRISYSVERLEKDKCYLEHYGLSRPGYEVATNNRSNVWIYVVVSALIVLLSGIAIRRYGR